ncbi:MAG TPA: hypothetical protein VMZ52_03065 [Bryobacteraceae bacterium]|nr:hypothetical protein [Bryobacteraceae bacterium]
MKIETLAVHAGRYIDPATGAVTPPIPHFASFPSGCHLSRRSCHY